MPLLAFDRKAVRQQRRPDPLHSKKESPCFRWLEGWVGATASRRPDAVVAQPVALSCRARS
jgi:hypothetical protein